MNNINFSHVYCKMINDNGENPPKFAKLINCIIIDKTNLPIDFIEYDTKYINGHMEEHHYPLPDGRLIMLMLLTDWMLWTTIRRYTPEKYNYYKSQIGQEFNIIIKEE